MRKQTETRFEFELVHWQSRPLKSSVQTSVPRKPLQSKPDSTESFINTRKRKVRDRTSSIEILTKRARKNQPQEENNQPTTSSRQAHNHFVTSAFRRGPFADLTNRLATNSSCQRQNSPPTPHRTEPATGLVLVANSDALNAATQSAATTTPYIAQLTLGQIKSEYIPRISLKCIHKMLTMHLGTSTLAPNMPRQGITNSYVSASLRTGLDDTFVQLMFQVIEVKFRQISTSQNRTSDTALVMLDVYDPQQTSSVELFRFLRDLWMLLSQRVNGIDAQSHPVFRNNNVNDLFPARFHARTLKLIQLARVVWSIVDRRFQRHKAELGHVERDAYAHKSFELIKQGHDELCAKLFQRYVFSCLRTTKFFLYLKPSLRVIGHKCVSELLGLIDDILRTVVIKSHEYDLLTDKLYFMAKNNIVNNEV